MKYILSILIMATSFTTANAQSKKENDQINAAVETLRKAIVEADKTVLEKITTNKLSYGHSGGKIEDQTQFISSLTSGKSDFVTMDLSEQTTAISGKTAIVRHTLTATTNDGGKPGNVKIYVLLVWAKVKGDWKLVGRQATKIPEKY